MMRSRALDDGFASPSSRINSSRKADAAAAAIAVLLLSMGLMIALAVLTIRVAAAMHTL